MGQKANARKATRASRLARPRASEPATLKPSSRKPASSRAALDLNDHSVLEAVERGTASLSEDRCLAICA